MSTARQRVAVAPRSPAIGLISGPQKYPEIHRSYPRLRKAVIEAWNSITNEEIRELIGTMHERCQAVIDAQVLSHALATSAR
jgi:hypothetical protein